MSPHIRDRRKVSIPGTYEIKRSGKDRRVFNWGIALLGLMVSIIPMLIVAVLIKVTTGGPAFYVQRRVGRNGTTFKMYKFCTMYATHNKQVWASEDDNRITPIGKFLRKTRLDELPQFYNVVIGNMNVVGPRPEQPRIAVELGKTIDGYHDRMEVLPGITGLAQVTLPPDQTVNDVRNKLKLDKEYIRTQSVWTDLLIMMKTPIVMFRRRQYDTKR